MTNTFSKASRLLARRQFRKRGNRKYGRYLVIDIRDNDLGYSRLGITASRHYGNAVRRNRFKRIVREAFRLSQASLLKGLDLNVRPRPYAQHAKTPDIIKELLEIIG